MNGTVLEKKKRGRPKGGKNKIKTDKSSTPKKWKLQNKFLQNKEFLVAVWHLIQEKMFLETTVQPHQTEHVPTQALLQNGCNDRRDVLSDAPPKMKPWNKFLQDEEFLVAVLYLIREKETIVTLLTMY